MVTVNLISLSIDSANTTLYLPLYVDILFTLSLGSGQVDEAGGNAEAIVTPMGPVPLQLVLFVSTVSGTATGNTFYDLKHLNFTLRFMQPMLTSLP